MKRKSPAPLSRLGVCRLGLCWCLHRPGPCHFKFISPESEGDENSQLEGGAPQKLGNYRITHFASQARNIRSPRLPVKHPPAELRASSLNLQGGFLRKRRKNFLATMLAQIACKFYLRVVCCASDLRFIAFYTESRSNSMQRCVSTTVVHSGASSPVFSKRGDVVEPA